MYIVVLALFMRSLLFNNLDLGKVILHIEFKDGHSFPHKLHIALCVAPLDSRLIGVENHLSAMLSS